MNQTMINMNQTMINMNQTMINMNQTMINMNQTMINMEKNIRQDMNQTMLLLHGHYAKTVSSNSIGFIKVFTKSNSKNYSASGNLIKIGSELFFSTCAHVIVVNKEVCHVFFIELLNHTKLTVEDSIYIYSIRKEKNHYYDYALIKIKETDELLSRAANISKRDVQLGDTIRGISYRSSGPIYIEGNVVEFSKDYTNILQTNTGGTYGFSGSG
jgi:hypothetical protein